MVLAALYGMGIPSYYGLREVFMEKRTVKRVKNMWMLYAVGSSFFAKRGY